MPPPASARMTPMRLSDLDYPLPEELIAQVPAERRDRSRLMVLDRATRSILHHRFADLPELLQPEDLLVLNESRVFPARLHGRRQSSGARLEVLLLRRRPERIWECLVKPARKARPGDRIVFQEGQFEARVMPWSRPEMRLLCFQYQGRFQDWLERLGEVPLPPYIRREVGPEDGERYQTVYARPLGSVAAPTAGLHFTPELLGQLRHCAITLHVGYGTFQPICTERIEEHRLHQETYRIGSEAARRMGRQLEAGDRIVAVGTTTVRALEQVLLRHGRMLPEKGSTDLFIRPGFTFRAVGALLTNFHLPRTSLLLLVAAFAGQELMQEGYRLAIQHRYRFYSYGDAMLVR